MKTFLFIVGFLCNIFLCAYPFQELTQTPVPPLQVKKKVEIKEKTNEIRKPLAYNDLLKNKAASIAQR